MLLRKKKKSEEAITEKMEVEEEKPSGSTPTNLGQVIAEVDKLKAQFSSFYELQKASAERFTRINEQIGELRAMMIERDRSSQHLEAKATQAIDLVGSVQPDKLMVEVRRGDTKVEALKANLESNETIMHNIVVELKEMRKKINSIRGMEEMLKISDEAKNELLLMKKVKATIERHADKMETIFSETQRTFRDFKKFGDVTKELDSSFKQIGGEFDSIKARVPGFATKKELENLVSRLDDFEKRAGNILEIMNKRFNEIKKDLDKMLTEKLKRVESLLSGFEILAKKTPDLDKYFSLLEDEAKKVGKKKTVEKLKEPGEQEKLPEAKEEKKGVLKKVLSKGAKK